ncbi:MAG TPA: hypothetical protein H9671_06375 [Firmicutes bacterium]|nr:hypothetical protein [Bacillota bacterium]
MADLRNGNYTRYNPERDVIPERTVFPLTDFHKRNKKGELIPETTERDALVSKLMVDANEK